DEPADEAAQADAEDVRDPLVAAERRDLAEHAVAIRLRLALEVLRQLPGLPERVLARRRVGVVRSRLVRDACAVAEGPDVLEPFHAQRRVDPHAPPLVDREPEPREHRVRADAGRPDAGSARAPVAA